MKKNNATKYLTGVRGNPTGNLSIYSEGEHLIPTYYAPGQFNLIVDRFNDVKTMEKYYETFVSDIPTIKIETGTFTYNEDKNAFVYEYEDCGETKEEYYPIAASYQSISRDSDLIYQSSAALSYLFRINEDDSVTSLYVD